MPVTRALWSSRSVSNAAASDAVLPEPEQELGSGPNAVSEHGSTAGLVAEVSFEAAKPRHRPLFEHGQTNNPKRPTVVSASPTFKPTASKFTTSKSTAPRSTASKSTSRPSSMTTQDLLAMIDDLPTQHVDKYLDFHRDTRLRRHAPPDGPKVTVSGRPVDYNYPSLEQSVGRNDHTREIYAELVAATRLHSPSRSSVNLATLLRIYKKLPEPRMLHISADMRHRLLWLFGTPERRDSPAMLRYFGLMEDVKSSGLALSVHEWNYSLAFAKRYVSLHSDVRAGSEGVGRGGRGGGGGGGGGERGDESWIKTALRIWSDMEKTGNVRANGVTFNLLFDAAAKTGNFRLAQMLYHDMQVRGIKFNRFHHVSLISYFGLRQNGDGVRAAYKDMVLAREIVDVVVLNAVISGFLNAGEEEAAEFVYRRMKACGLRATGGPPPVDYRLQRVVAQVLMMWSRLSRKHPKLRPGMQAQSPMAPDTRTYRIFVQHYAVRMGDMARVAAYLDDMHWFKIPMDGRIFVTLFEAFARHGGGRPDDEFSRTRLQSIFAALTAALDEQVSGVYVDTWMVMWTLRAFKKCAGDMEVLHAYAQMKKRWELGVTKTAYLEGFMRRVVEGRDGWMKEGGDDEGKHWQWTRMGDEMVNEELLGGKAEGEAAVTETNEGRI
ncbi:hypothetical protein TD95_004584 [Thielaviopsis punctulata]|uniref:Pentacotripeptide-repeat region of PRORP domain-containing protein n=1 Tax=Thielaviopsis punctulata TaxID=72032 RepID=A0A0F4ZIQ1_9PEZI|nr:hypothetical protein TD95_004584 [Thielaviopsis punctulata]